MTKAILIVLSIGTGTIVTNIYITDKYIYFKPVKTILKQDMDRQRILDLTTSEHHHINHSKKERIVSDVVFHKDNWKATKKLNSIPLNTLIFMNFNSQRLAESHSFEFNHPQLDNSTDTMYSIHSNLDNITNYLGVEPSVLNYLPIYKNKIKEYPFELKRWTEFDNTEHVISEVKAIEFGYYPIEEEIKKLLAIPEKK